MNWILVLELIVGALCAGLVQWLGTHLAFLPARRLPADAHWTEHAQKSWSARLLISAGPAIILGFMLFRTASHLHGAEGVLRVILLPICLTIGGIAGGVPVIRRILDQRVRFGDLLREYAVTFLLRGSSLTVLLVMLILLIPRRLDATSIGIMIGGLVLAFALTIGLAVPLARAIGLLLPAPPRLLEIVRSAAEQAGFELPPVYLVRWYQANAFAFVFSRTLAFTQPALEILSDQELRAVCLHEIAHLQESTRNKAVRLSSIFAIFPMFTFPVWSKSFGIPGILVPFGIVMVANRFFRGFSQRMEKAADAAAYSEQEGDAACYAQALEKIYRFNLIPAVMRGKAQAHPHLYDRLAAAGITPDYPRPKAPSIILFVLTSILLVIGTIVPLEVIDNWSRNQDIEHSSEEFSDDAPSYEE